MTKTNTTTSDHDLLLRIDERQENIVVQLTSIKRCLDGKVDDDSDYQELKVKVDSLWDSKNKVIGWMLGAGVAGGTIASIIKGLVTEVLAKL